MQFSTLLMSILSLSVIQTLAAPVAIAAPNAIADPEPRKYISYGALAGDRAPNGPAKQANPYTKPCTKEDRCARDTGK